MIKISHWNVIKMLVSLLGGIINKYLREYFEDIDTNQMGGSFFGGDISLKNLRLRPNIFEQLGLPFHVIAGKCGKLEVQYSLFKLYSEPIVIKLKELSVLACPSKLAHYDEAEEKAASQQEKLRQLEEYEHMKSHMAEAQQITENAAPQATTYDAWVNSIIRNINVKVESVHIRFEDDITKKLEPFTMGITIQDLEVLTTDSSWKSQYIKQYCPETAYKLVKLTGLCAYWNSAPTPLYKNLDKQVLYQRLAPILKMGEPRNPAFKTLIGPLTIEVKIQVTLSPDTMQKPFSKPTVRVDTFLKELFCTVSDKQIQDILPYIETLDIFAKTLQFKKYRPEIPGNAYRGHYKKWWKFAYKCVLEDIQRRRNNFRWTHIKAHRDKCWKYLKTYYKKKIKNNPKPELDEILAKLEEDLDLFNIILLRRHVELVGLKDTTARLSNSSPTDDGYVSSTVNWIWSWFSSPPPPQEIPLAPPPQSPPDRKRKALSSATPELNKFFAAELSRKDKEDLGIAVGFAKNVYYINYPTEYTDIEIAILLSSFRAQLNKYHKNRKETVLDMICENVGLGFSTRPVNDGLIFEVKMGRVDAFGGDHHKHSVGGREDFFSSPQILTTAASPSLQQEYLLKFSYEASPLDSAVDHKISFEALGLQFIYNTEAIDKLVEFFSIPKRILQPKIIGTIPATKILKNILNFKNSSHRKLLQIMENQGKIEVNICLITPYVVIPQEGPNNQKSSFFVVQLGEINLVGTVMGGTICEHGGCSSFI